MTPVTGGRNSTWKIHWILSTARWIKTPRVEIQWGQNSILHRPVALRVLTFLTVYECIDSGNPDNSAIRSTCCCCFVVAIQQRCRKVSDMPAKPVKFARFRQKLRKYWSKCRTCSSNVVFVKCANRSNHGRLSVLFFLPYTTKRLIDSE